MKMQYTVKIPWVAPQFATEWHPTKSTGPLATVVRGSFSSPEAAIEWAQNKLNGTPYSIEPYPVYAD